ncbi:MAG: hypothetical protein HC921_19965 [Synechococcaceae cyanobacterium SM2_3_1]|nr:hypothetical protein [Synechococcaceae cyanobacterium SM2_3_1]
MWFGLSRVGFGRQSCLQVEALTNFLDAHTNFLVFEGLIELCEVDLGLRLAYTHLAYLLNPCLNLGGKVGI